MTATQLVRELRACGAQAWLEGDQLRLRGPAGFLTPALKDALQDHRAELCRLLRKPSDAVNGHAAGRSAPGGHVADGHAADGDLTAAVGAPELYPLSYNQRQLWFEQQLQPDAHHYNVPVALQLDADARVDAAVQALRWIARRHETLRARYPIRGEQPVMEIAPDERPLVVPLIDLDGDADDAAVRDAMVDVIRRPFALSAEPPIRACVLRRGARERLLIVCLHHIATDGWSMQVLMRDFQEAYEAFAAGGPVAPPPRAAVNYGAFARWQTSPERRAAWTPLLAAATARLRGTPDLRIPADVPPPAAPTARGGLCTGQLARPEVDALSAVARQSGVTLFTLCAAAYAIVLAQESGQDRFALGTDAAGRDDPSWETIVGHFVNQIVLVADLSGNPTLREIIRRVSDEVMRAYAAREVPFDRLVKAMRAHGGDRTPLFRAKIVMQPPLDEAWRADGIALRAVHDGSCKFELLLNVWLTADGAGLAVEYSRDRFVPATGERLLRQLRLVLRTLPAESRDLRLSELFARMREAEGPTRRTAFR